MSLTEQHYKKLLHVTECLSYGLDSAEIRTAVGEALLELLDADYFASYVWNSVARRFEEGVSINMDNTDLNEYDEYFQFHDPITHQLQRRKRASCVNRVMEQEELKKTEFFNDFLSTDGLYWGINLYAYDGQDNIGDIRIWRNKSKNNFDSSSEDLLEIIRPHFTNALRNTRRHHDDLQSDTASLSEPSISASWDASVIADKFGFTRRESEIVREILRGKKDESIAEELCIAYSTVRSHIKHIYEKTGVHNRSSLCHKVLNQLTGLI